MLLLYTDVVIEARSPTDEFFGQDRLVDLVSRHLATGLPAPEMMRRLVHALLAHQSAALSDDATLMLVVWLGVDRPHEVIVVCLHPTGTIRTVRQQEASHYRRRSLCHARTQISTGSCDGRSDLRPGRFRLGRLAQANPPEHWGWRLALGLLGLAGLALAALGAPLAVRHWDAPTALQSGTVALLDYIIVFWVEVVLAALLAFAAVRAGRSDLIAPLILGVVGVHFFALAPVFAQPVLYLAAVLLTAVAIVASLVPASSVERSFWCGILGAPVFLTIGMWVLVAASTTFRNV